MTSTRCDSSLGLVLHKAARGSRPSSHSWPIGRRRNRCCCLEAVSRPAVDGHDDADDADDEWIDDLETDWLGDENDCEGELGPGLGFGRLGLGLGLEAQLDWRT